MGRLLEVTGEPFLDEEPIWSSSVYRSRVPVRAVLQLAPEHGVPVLEVREELTVFGGQDNPNRWQDPSEDRPTRASTFTSPGMIRAGSGKAIDSAICRVPGSSSTGFESQSPDQANPRISDLEAITAWRINPSSQAHYAMLEAASGRRPLSSTVLVPEPSMWWHSVQMGRSSRPSHRTAPCSYGMPSAASLLGRESLPMRSAGCGSRQLILQLTSKFARSSARSARAARSARP